MARTPESRPAVPSTALERAPRIPSIFEALFCSSPFPDDVELSPSNLLWLRVHNKALWPSGDCDQLAVYFFDDNEEICEAFVVGGRHDGRLVVFTYAELQGLVGVPGNGDPAFDAVEEGRVPVLESEVPTKKNETVIDEKEQRLLDFVTEVKNNDRSKIAQSNTALLNTPIFEALENEAGAAFARKMLVLFDDIADAWTQVYVDHVKKSPTTESEDALFSSFFDAVDAMYKRLSPQQSHLIDEAMRAEATRQKEAFKDSGGIILNSQGGFAFRNAMRSAFNAGFIRQPTNPADAPADGRPLAVPFGEEDRVPPAEARELILTSGKTAEQFAQEIVARKDRIREIIMSRLGFLDKAALTSRVTELQQLGPEIQQLLQRGIDAKNAILKWRQDNNSDVFDARITKTHTAELQFVAELSQTFSDQGITNIASGGASAIKSFLDNNVPVLRGKIKKIIEEYGNILTDIKK